MLIAYCLLPIAHLQIFLHLIPKTFRRFPRFLRKVFPRRREDDGAAGIDQQTHIAVHGLPGNRFQATSLGTDSGNPLEMQKDFQHLREWRTAGTELKRKGMVALLGIFFSGLAGLLVLGFREWGKS